MTNFIEEFYYGNLDPQARRGTLTHLQMECKLNSHLYDINFQAEAMFDALIKHFKQAE